MSSITTVQICKDVFEYYFAGFVCKGGDGVKKAPILFDRRHSNFKNISLFFW